MTGELLAARELNRAFTLAVFLTGSIKSAEAAVLRAICALEAGDVHGDGLVSGTVEACVHIQRGLAARADGEMVIYRAALPVELQRVLQLPLEMRQCFVLRNLVGLSLKASAGLLDLEPQEVTARTSAAMRDLAVIAEGERRTMALRESVAG